MKLLKATANFVYFQPKQVSNVTFSSTLQVFAMSSIDF